MYLRTVAATFAAVMLAYAAVEVSVDEFGVFRHVDARQRACMPNARAVKLYQLSQDRDPDAFVLGSSRANYYRVASLRRLSGRNYYNLSSPMENSLGMERWVRWLATHRDVRQVVLTLDFDLQEHPYNPDDPFVRDPPALTGEPRAVFLARYLLTPPDQLIACVRARARGSAYSFDAQTGEDHNAAATPMRYAPVTMELFAAHRDDASTERLARMVAQLRAEGTDVRVVVNPIWAQRFLTFRQQTYQRWLRNVVRATGGVWDFSGVNEVTARMGNYYDDVHFTEAIGDRVLETVYGRRHDGFGVFVDAQNVDARVAQIDRDFAGARAVARPGGEADKTAYRGRGALGQ